MSLELQGIDYECAPKVSVIIPVYNEKQYLSETLESVINQTYKNLEIVVVDDGSDDGSEKISDEYAIKDNRIRVIHKKNEGLSAARNAGLDNIKGEYVTFIDSDDIYHPDMIKKMLEAIILKDADCVICQYIFLKEKQNINFKKISAKKKNKEKLYSREEALKAISERKINIYAWNKFYKRKLFENIRYPIGQNYEDRSVIFNIIDKTKKIFILSDVLVLYRRHSNSITSTICLKNIQDFYKAYDSYDKFIEKNIPEIFTKNDLIKSHKHKFKALISYYANTIYQNIPDKKNIQKFLKEKIKELNFDNEVKEFDLEALLFYYLLFYAPVIFSVCALFYPTVRSIIKR